MRGHAALDDALLAALVSLALWVLYGLLSAPWRGSSKRKEKGHRCGEKSYLGAINGKLVVNTRSDVSGEL